MTHCPQCYHANRKACFNLRVEKERLNFIELMRDGVTKCSCVCHMLACKNLKKEKKS